MFCPNCTGNLFKNPKHAEGVWTCESCTSVYFILACEKSGKKVEPEDSADKINQCKHYGGDCSNGEKCSDECFEPHGDCIHPRGYIKSVRICGLCGKQLSG